MTGLWGRSKLNFELCVGRAARGQVGGCLYGSGPGLASATYYLSMTMLHLQQVEVDRYFAELPPTHAIPVNLDT